MKQAEPTIVELNMDDLDALLRRVEIGQLEEGDRETIKTVLLSYVNLTDTLKDKNVSMRRLRKMLFGLTTEKTAAILGDETDSSTPSSLDKNAAAEAADQMADSQITPDKQAKQPPKGHGRNGAEAYAGAEKIQVSHDCLQPGDDCPCCDKGTVYETNRPGVLVRLSGHAPVRATVYQLQKLRCGLCGKVFKAPMPESAGERKYDATAGSMIALLKYGSGMPFNRFAGLQGNLGVPLPASTQWEVVESMAKQARPAYDELIRQAAGGDILYNDDTTVKILERMGKRAQQKASGEGAADADADENKKWSHRTGLFTSGLFTSGIISTREGRRIALFFSGRQHAGENLGDVLKERAQALRPPIQMCDALSRNLPAELETIVAHCLAHSRRQFDDRLAEPNSSLGKAIAYMLRHWPRLTLFLRQPGAPLDNNICERALKKAIRHRKNSLFYKTDNGARVGDLFMSLIHTCELYGANAFDYLAELNRHATDLHATPKNWMPWNYRATLDSIIPPNPIH